MIIPSKLAKELADRREAIEYSRMSAEDKISSLLARIENLEQKLNELEQKEL